MLCMKPACDARFQGGESCRPCPRTGCTATTAIRHVWPPLAGTRQSSAARSTLLARPSKHTTHRGTPDLWLVIDGFAVSLHERETESGRLKSVATVSCSPPYSVHST